MSFFKTDEKSRSFWDWLCGYSNIVKLEAEAKARVPQDYEVDSTNVLAKIIYLDERDNKVDAAIRFTGSVHDHYIYGIIVTSGEHGFNKWLEKSTASGYVDVPGFEGKTKELIPMSRVLKVEAKNTAVKLKYRK